MFVKIPTMNHLLKAEEAAILGVCIILNNMLIPYAWWWYWVLFLTPDISMIGYVVNTKVGAALYNFGHHKGTAVLCFTVGIILSSTAWQFAGLLLLGHSSFDRILGYGLKYPDNFKNTHLGMIGK
jgi:hypothetical protein